MTLKAVITQVDELRPNAYSDDQKTAWINEIEGKIQTEIFLFAPAQIVQYTYSRDQNTELLTAPPHHTVYISFLCAMIDFANGEYNRYNNSMQMFNTQYVEFMRWFAKRYRPADQMD